jgi:hypothetical protein
MPPHHTFQLVFALSGVDSLEPHLAELHAAGCDDAAFIGPAADGTVVAEFDREAPTRSLAVESAVDAIGSVLPLSGAVRVVAAAQSSRR